VVEQLPCQLCDQELPGLSTAIIPFFELVAWNDQIRPIFSYRTASRTAASAELTGPNDIPATAAARRAVSPSAEAEQL
jgi:hypothetical protein